MPMSDGKSKRNEPEGGQLSRREWLLKLGEAAVLLGFTDAAGEAEATLTLAPALGFVPLPALFWPILLVTVICYVGLTQIVKTWLIKKAWV